MNPATNIVSAQWLLTHINDENLVVLDASMGVSGKVNEAGFEAIPGAQHFDFEKAICDQGSHLPNMMPNVDHFEAEVKKLGVKQDSLIVVYDNKGVYSAPRAWWMFKVMGHDKVVVLNGGLSAWKEAGGDVAAISASDAVVGDFCCVHCPDKMVSVDAVLKNLENPQATILDARSPARFSGAEADPRPHIQSGHIPTSKNLCFAELQNEGCMLPAEALDKKFSALGLVKEDKIIFSCGSGVTACILALGASEAGYHNLAVYDGSWSEWGAGDKYPVVQDNL